MAPRAALVWLSALRSMSDAEHVCLVQRNLHGQACLVIRQHGFHFADRRQTVPLRGHGPQLPVRGDSQDRDAQPGRGSQDRGRARVALTALAAAGSRPRRTACPPALMTDFHRWAPSARPITKMDRALSGVLSSRSRTRANVPEGPRRHRYRRPGRLDRAGRRPQRQQTQGVAGTIWARRIRTRRSRLGSRYSAGKKGATWA